MKINTILTRVRLVLLPLLLVLACLATARAQTVDDGFSAGVTGTLVPSVIALALQPDGKILIGGWFTEANGVTRTGIARLNANGNLDSAFNPNVGLSNLASPHVNGGPNGGPQGGLEEEDTPVIFCLAVQPDGKILMGGSFTHLGGQGRNNIARLNPDGSLDAAFNPGSGASNQVFALALQSNGKIVIGGDFTAINNTSRNRIARLNANGSLDSTFSPGLGANGYVNSLAVLPDGKILMGGAFTQVGGQGRNNIARLNANGSLDAAFNPGANGQVSTLVLQPDGKILMGGSFTQVDGQTRNRIARLNPDGSLDATFNPGPGVDSQDAHVYSLALQANGRVLLAGYFTSVSDTQRNRIARLNANGSLDATFDPGDGPSGNVFSLAVQADGRILMGGEFTQVDGQPHNRIARLHNTSAAMQSLSLSRDRSTLTWTRDGTSPEFQRVTFELSTDGQSWSLLGQGTNFSYIMPGMPPSLVRGWSLDGLSLPAERRISIRARGFHATGYRNGSGSMAETTLHRGGALPGATMLLLLNEDQ